MSAYRFSLKLDDGKNDGLQEAFRKFKLPADIKIPQRFQLIAFLHK